MLAGPDENFEDYESGDDGEDEEINNLRDGFLNLCMTDQIRAFLEDDSLDEDTVFYGFLSNLPGLPGENWQSQKKANLFNTASYTGASGPTISDPPGEMALDYFSLYFDDDFCEKIVKWTNENAAKKIEENPEKNKTKWTPVSLTELKAFFGVLLFIELYFSGRIEELWNLDPEKPLLDFPGIRRVFTRVRFVQILRYLHFTPEGLARGCRENPAFDKLYKVRPLLNHIRAKCLELYTPPCNMSLDEGMVPFRGRLGFKQYHKDKPCKWGIKAWMLCAAESGYLYNFEIYTGKDADANQLNAPTQLTVRIVLNLVQPIVGSGRHIYFDRFYTSRLLLYQLAESSLFACGTVQTNRGFPKEIVPASAKELPRGSHLWRQDHSTGVLALTWQDQKPIYFESTIHEPDDEILHVQRHTKQGEALEVSAPPAVVDYNKYMAGVDTNDRMTKLDKSRKTYHWYNRLSRKCLLWAAYNGYIIEGHFKPHSVLGKRKRDFRSFLVELLHQLVGGFTMRGKPGQKRKSFVGDRLLEPEYQHFPEEGEGADHVCVVCNAKFARFKKSNPDIPYGQCPVKRSKTSYRCSKCDVYLCNRKGFSCFRDYHSKVEYWR